jgi:cell wall-associated NlpC family hydrolase
VPRRRTVLLALPAIAVLLAAPAAAGNRDWAAPQILQVTQAGILGTSPASFRPQSPLTQAQLEAAVSATAAAQAPAPATTPPQPRRVVVTSTVGNGAVVAGTMHLEIAVPTQQPVDHVDVALDGTGITTAHAAPYAADVDTTTLPNGPHQVAVNVALTGGGFAIAVWSVTVANATGAATTPAAATPVPVVKVSLPPVRTVASAAPVVAHTLYRAAVPSQPVTIRQLDAALVSYLGLVDAARAIQSTLRAAGLQPPADTGTEAVARMLDLRLNHPAADDDLEILPDQPATRAEAAYSFAQLLRLEPSALDAVRTAAAAFTLPELTPWQQRILTTAVHYVGYPYVWGGTDPTAETEFGVRSAGGFDCSGFVWRVYKLTPYAGEGALATVLRGRTTYEMSGEVPRRLLLPATKLQPGDVMFFGAHGPRSKPSEVDHTALYLGNGWFVQSSDEGVTLLPFSGWYAHSFAWARRPLHEAGLD